MATPRACRPRIAAARARPATTARRNPHPPRPSRAQKAIMAPALGKRIVPALASAKGGRGAGTAPATTPLPAPPARGPATPGATGFPAPCAAPRDATAPAPRATTAPRGPPPPRHFFAPWATFAPRAQPPLRMRHLGPRRRGPALPARMGACRGCKAYRIAPCAPRVRTTAPAPLPPAPFVRRGRFRNLRVPPATRAAPPARRERFPAAAFSAKTAPPASLQTPLAACFARCASKTIMATPLAGARPAPPESTATCSAALQLVFARTAPRATTARATGSSHPMAACAQSASRESTPPPRARPAAS